MYAYIRHTPKLQVEGSFEDWMEVLKLLYDGGQERFGFKCVSMTEPGRPCPSVAMGRETHLSPSIAFRVFPIAHAYNMWGVLKRCTKSALECLGEADRTAPDLFQWLAAADARHYTPMITACLERLREQHSAAAAGGSGDESSGGSGSKATPAALDMDQVRCSAIRSMLCDKEHRMILEGLKPDTAFDLVGVMAGLPLGYKVRC